MRSSVAVALIVCGTMFALMPVASDYFHGYQVSQFLSDRYVQFGVTRIHQPFGETFRASAWVLGGVMIGLGAVSGSLSAVFNVARRERTDWRHDMLGDSNWGNSERTRSTNS
jgi:hypothetical protein